MDSPQGTTVFPKGLLPAREEEMSPRNSPTLVNSSSSTDVWGCAPTPLPEQWPLSRGSLRTQSLARPCDLKGSVGMDILHYILQLRLPEGVGRREEGGEELLFKTFLSGFFQLPLFDEEPTAEACHSELGAHLTLLSLPCTWCVFAAVLITLTSLFINILNQCRRLC